MMSLRRGIDWAFVRGVRTSFSKQTPESLEALTCIKQIVERSSTLQEAA